MNIKKSVDLGLIFGIISVLVLSWVFFGNYESYEGLINFPRIFAGIFFGFPLGIAAFVLGIKTLSNLKNKKINNVTLKTKAIISIILGSPIFGIVIFLTITNAFF